MEWVVVALGGALGSVGRFGLSRWVQSLSGHSSFPLGIYACNVIGSLLIGVFYAVLVHRLEVGPLWRAFILIGFFGGFTTFSSFSLDTVNLLMQNMVFLALVNVLASVITCVLGAALGMGLVRFFV